jgi:hypothetical protein
MPFNAREFGYAWRHIGLGVVRRLSRQPQEKFINLYRAKGVPLRPLYYEGTVQKCQLCGYALAEMELLPEGWLLQACSAVGFESLIGNERLALWTKEIGLTQPENRAVAGAAVDERAPQDSNEASKSSLPTIGV